MPGKFEELRNKMVGEQLVKRGITDVRVIEAMRKVPRHLFVPKKLINDAYEDGPLPIGRGQTISQPYIVALMAQLLNLTGGERVLEIGAGSGYQAAVLGMLADQVYAIEIEQQLGLQARAVIRECGINNVQVIIGDGSRGLSEFIPYDGIVISAAAPVVAKKIAEQLAEGGRMAIPVGGPKGQVLWRWVRKGATFIKKRVIPVAFVPLRGDLGWSKKDWDRSNGK